MSGKAALVVDILYRELIDPEADLSERIQQGFGPSGLGILTVSGVPNLLECRQGLLPLASRFAGLPRAVQEQYEDPASAFNFGWSHGREAMRDGQKDTHKGSYYANPLHDVPTQDPSLIAEFPSYYRPNMWPNELPELEPAFKALGQLMCAAGELLMKRCDEYASSANPTIPQGKLCGILSRSRNHKARLLHYFPPSTSQPATTSQTPSSTPKHQQACSSVPAPQLTSSWPAGPPTHSTTSGLDGVDHSSTANGVGSGTTPSAILVTGGQVAGHGGSEKVDTTPPCDGDGDGSGRSDGSGGGGGTVVVHLPGLQQPAAEVREWCGWHTDHGSITALTSAIYCSSSGVEVPNPDSASGLYIEDRQGNVVKAVIGPSQIAFQVGEALQVHSGGLLRATPHCVRAASGPASEGISRNTFAVFMQPGSREPLDLPHGVSAAEVAVGQWQEGMDFGEFSTATFAKYYGS